MAAPAAPQCTERARHMQTPIQVSFHGTPISDELEATCRREAAKLERYFERVTACRIAIEKASHRHHKGDHWRIRVRLTVPGREIVVKRDPPEDATDEKLELALRESFDRARRRLQDHARLVDARVKHHAVRRRPRPVLPAKGRTPARPRR